LWGSRIASVNVSAKPSNKAQRARRKQGEGFVFVSPGVLGKLPGVKKQGRRRVQMPLFGPPNIEELERKRDVQGLIKAVSYKKDGKVRRAAVQALGRMKDARTVDLLVTALKDQDKDVRLAAVQALGRSRMPAPLSRWWQPSKTRTDLCVWKQRGR